MSKSAHSKACLRVFHWPPVARSGPVRLGLAPLGPVLALLLSSLVVTLHTRSYHSEQLSSRSHCEGEKLKAIEANCTNKSTRSVYANPLPIHSIPPSVPSPTLLLLPLTVSPSLLCFPCFSRHHLFTQPSPLYFLSLFPLLLGITSIPALLRSPTSVKSNKDWLSIFRKPWEHGQ